MNGKVVALAVGTLLWVVSLALASFGPGELWQRTSPLSWIAVGLTVAMGIVWIVVHARFLRASDELDRKILLDAMGIALGVALVGGFALGAAENAGLLAWESDIAAVSMLAALTYMVAIAVGKVRYR